MIVSTYEVYIYRHMPGHYDNIIVHMRRIILSLCLLVIAGAGPDTQPSTGPATQPDPEHEWIKPLMDAAVGDWVAYRTINGGQHLRVTHLTRLLAEVEVRSQYDGKMVGLPAIRSLRQDSDYALDFADSDGAAVEFGRETIAAAGRRWDCRLTIARWNSGSTSCERRIWMHREIPVYGMVRMELRAGGRLTAQMELVGFGHATTTQPDK